MIGTPPPTEPSKLAAWFAEAVRVEIAELEKKGGEQKYELHSGQRVTPEGSLYAIYRFTLADSTLVPEDASGVLDVNGSKIKATVVAQDSSRVNVQLEGAEALGEYIARAVLRVDDLGLLRKLSEALHAIASGAESVSALAAAIFHPESTSVCKAPLPATPMLDRVTGEQRHVLEQASASQITFVWGPPGTGKTYVIAHLIAALVARGERVLMTSHTHAAVDQAVYETVKSNGGTASSTGPLANSDLEREGSIIRVGRVPSDSKVPESVRLDSIMTRQAQGIQLEISRLQPRAVELSAIIARLKTKLASWERLHELKRQLAVVEQNARMAVALHQQRQRALEVASLKVTEKRENLVLDQEWQPFDMFTTWFNVPAKRVARAREALAKAEVRFAHLSRLAKHVSELAIEAQQCANVFRDKAAKQVDSCVGLPDAKKLEQQLADASAELNQTEQTLSEQRRQLDALEKELITKARVVAATLTKCYVGDQLDGQEFDAVIVDEISMALPPLLFIAGRSALRRVILVGDFKQLPPIVRSDSEISDERLATDAFRLAGLTNENNELTNPADPCVARLSTQRRMLPQIADVARQISYGTSGLIDHSDVGQRAQPDWLAFLEARSEDTLFNTKLSNALTVVDTADLHAWSGRQAGSLSRFNLYSAQIAVELAAMAAARISKVEQDNAPPIGIVTPYAAQRRLLSRLIHALELSALVAAGTVHTFQGGEAELIIFDSVLDEPYWTARLSNPNRSKEVKRDLNVAVTRAKSKFVLVASSEWLNRHAKLTSGLGQLWYYLKEHAELVPAHELVKPGIAGRIVGGSPREHEMSMMNGEAVLQRLNQDTFFDRFASDLASATRSIFGHLAFFGEYRWAKIEPLFRAALERGVEVTLITPPPANAQNRAFVVNAIEGLRHIGARVVTASGLHGKDVAIDSHILYTGSLNVASHRGTSEDVHRIFSSEYVQHCMELMQADHICSAVGAASHARVCPKCAGPVQVVNMRKLRQGDKQPLKIGCYSHQVDKELCEGFLVDIDQRAPFSQPPLCEVDHQTKYRRVRRGRGQSWVCPKHPRECKRFKVVPGDVEC